VSQLSHVRPHVDARDEEKRVLRAERDFVVVRHVDAEARPGGVDAKRRRETDQEREDAVTRDLATCRGDTLHELRLVPLPFRGERLLPVRLEQAGEAFDKLARIVEQQCRSVSRSRAECCSTREHGRPHVSIGEDASRARAPVVVERPHQLEGGDVDAE
jgi:hypothetical protein